MDLNRLLEPISKADPCGVDLRTVDSSHVAAEKYFLLKEIRNDQRRQERKNIEVEHTLEINAKPWLEVVNLATELLFKYTKDLEVASWLLEGLVRTEKFSGLAQGLQIFTGLITKYSKQLYPLLEDEEEQDIRLASIGMLGGKHEVGTIVVALYYHALLPTVSGDNLNAWSVRRIIESQGGNADDVRPESLMEREEIRKAIVQLEAQEFDSIADDLANARERFVEFNKSLSAAFSASAPDLSGLRSTLEYCYSIAESIKAIRASQAVSARGEEDEEEEQPVSSFSREALSLSSLTASQLNKEGAIRILEVAAQFFLEADRHSPISYSLERIIRWARATLPEVLLETMEPNARSLYCKITGVPFAQKSDPEYQETYGSGRSADDY